MSLTMTQEVKALLSLKKNGKFVDIMWPLQRAILLLNMIMLAINMTTEHMNTMEHKTKLNSIN